MLLMIRIALSGLASRIADSRSSSVRHAAVYMLELLDYLPCDAFNTTLFSYLYYCTFRMPALT